jgi:Domain of unknown function (DUF4326)
MSVCNVKVAHIRPQYQNLKEWCEDPNNVYIGRRGIVFIDKVRYPTKDSIYANPYKVSKTLTREDVIRMYRDYIIKKISSGEIDIEALRGKNLGCWCKPEACHGDVLIELLESGDLVRDLSIENKAVDSGDGKDETDIVSAPESTAKGSNVVFSLTNVSSILQASRDPKNLVTKEPTTKKAGNAAANEDTAQKVKNPETGRMIVVGKGVYQKLIEKGYVLIDGNLVKGKTE